jgi:hypothetical protein
VGQFWTLVGRLTFPLFSLPLSVFIGFLFHRCATWLSRLLRFCCYPQRRGDQGSLLSTESASYRPFRQWLIGPTYRPSDGVGFHRSWFGIVFSRWRQAAPRWSLSGNRIPRGGASIRSSPVLHPKDGDSHTIKAEIAVPRSPPAWLLRHRSFSGRPGGPTLATYPRGKVARFGQEVLYRYGPAQVGFGDLVLLLSSPHRLFHGRLNPNHCGSRVLPGLCSVGGLGLQGLTPLAIDRRRLRG